MEDARRTCPLCGSGESAPFHRDARRKYLRCGQCALVFVPPRYFLSPAEERAYYDLHQNDPTDPHYRRFLSRLAEPLMQQLWPGARGLDFGSGPGPALSRMLTEAGFPTTIYDPFYAPGASVWMATYDFITASEVVEHLHHPRFELERLWSLVRTGGAFAIMTKRVRDRQAFANWHYKNDPTHVIFFSEATFIWLSRHWSAELQMVGPDVVLFRKLERCIAPSSEIPSPSQEYIMSSPHIIRLRGPWSFEPLSRTLLNSDGSTQSQPGDLPPPGRIKIPSDWSQAVGPDFYGVVRFARAFGRPTNLLPSDRIEIVIDAVDALGRVELNGAELGRAALQGGPFRFDVTGRLAPRNRLVIDVEQPRVQEGGSLNRGSREGMPGGLIGEVRLEITSE